MLIHCLPLSEVLMPRLVNLRTFYALFGLSSIVLTFIVLSGSFNKTQVELPEPVVGLVTAWFFLHSLVGLGAAILAMVKRLGLIFALAPVAFILAWAGFFLFTPLVPTTSDNQQQLLVTGAIAALFNMLLLGRTIAMPLQSKQTQKVKTKLEHQK